MRFRDFFKNHFTTTDNNDVEALRSHYYKGRYEEVRSGILKLIEKEKAIITSETEKYKEIVFETSKYEVCVKITDITPIEMAVDFNINTNTLISRGLGLKKIIEFYKYLDSILSFKGIGLYK